MPNFYRQKLTQSRWEGYMRFLVGTVGGEKSVFAVRGTEAVNLSQALPDIGNDLAALAANPALLAKAKAIEPGETIPVAKIIPALPIESPPTIICLGL
ncbi:MAG: hypothetical protein KJN93_00610, partial [Alphaproteobacteria bacterium]|nr:hypothetical protein [Alphaproteobacteria bacterium]